MTQRVHSARVPVEPPAPDPRPEPPAAASALPPVAIHAPRRPDRRRRRGSGRANLWGVDLRGLADILLALAVVLLLLAAVAAAVGLTVFAR